MKRAVRVGAIVFFAFGALVGAAFFVFVYGQNAPAPSRMTPGAHEAPAAENAASSSHAVSPAYVNISVPFSSQAPLGGWDQPWQDACEEASVLMAVAWARGISLTPALAQEEIMKQVAFEDRIFGYHNDTNAADTLRIISDFYRYPNAVARYSDVTIASIKAALASGNVVIVPLDGRILARENSYFTRPPYYHMIIIRGYDDAAGEFIVNEPGTRHGDAFRYSYETLFAAIHDWTGSAATVASGEKAMIIVGPVGSVAPSVAPGH